MMSIRREDLNGLVYLAAPYSDDDPQVVEERMRAFCEADAILTAMGVATVSPLLKHFIMPYGKSIGLEWSFWKPYAQQLMPRCDVLLILDLPGAGEAPGVSDEIALATDCRIPVLHVTTQTLRLLLKQLSS